MQTGSKARAAKLKREVERLEPGGSSRRYPPGLRSRISGFARERRSHGDSLASIARSVGVSEPTLARWVDEAPPAALVPVVVRDERPTRGHGEIVVRADRGLVIEGLSLDDVAALVMKVSSCSV